jgi:hypothetical protein
VDGYKGVAYAVSSIYLSVFPCIKTAATVQQVIALLIFSIFTGYFPSLPNLELATFDVSDIYKRMGNVNLRFQSPISLPYLAAVYAAGHVFALL